MAEQKTKPTDVPVEEFLDSLPAKRRDIGTRALEIFREVTGDDGVMWGPSMIGFGQFNYVSPRNPRTTGVWPKVAFSPRAAALTLYGLKGSPEQQELLQSLGSFTESVGCVYVKKLDEVDEAVLRRLIELGFAREDD